MNCHDAREGFSARFHGGMGLTEWALLDAHVRQCVECRKGRESVQEVVNSRQQVTPFRALLHCLRKMIDAIRLGTTSLAAWLTRVGVPLAISLTVAGLAVIEASRVAAAWIVDPLTRARWLLPKLFKLLVWAAATTVSEAADFVITGFADLLARLRSSLTIAGQGAARAAIEVARARVTRLITHCAQLQIWLRSSLLIVFTWAAQAAIEGARAGVTRLLDVLLLVRWLLPALLKVSERAAASVIDATRFARGRFADLLAQLRVPLGISLAVSGQAAVRMIEASRVGITWLVGLLARMRCVQPLLCTLSERTAVKASGATWVVGRIVVTTSGRWISAPRRRYGAKQPLTSSRMTSGTRSFRRVSTGIASLAILVATIVFLGPREWPDNLKPRPSTGGQLSQDVRPPADRKPVEPAAAAQLPSPSPHLGPPPRRCHSRTAGA